MRRKIVLNPRATLRREKSELAYAQDKLDGKLGRLIDEPAIKEFEYWRIVANRYPYDVSYQTCHMILPKRLVANENELTVAEADEFKQIKQTFINKNYDQIIENTLPQRSVLDHYHIHLVVFFDKRSEMGL